MQMGIQTFPSSEFCLPLSGAGRPHIKSFLAEQAAQLVGALVVGAQ
jgi:hypothetical protein